MKTTHTQGPWKVDDTGGLRGANDEPIYCKGADMQLIASAPELLHALEMMVHASREQAPTALAMAIDKARCEFAEPAIKKARKND